VAELLHKFVFDPDLLKREAVQFISLPKSDVHPIHDYRRFGYHILRDYTQYRELYNKRVTAERIFSRLKYNSKGR